jgi:Secretory lipase
VRHDVVKGGSGHALLPEHHGCAFDDPVPGGLPFRRELLAHGAAPQLDHPVFCRMERPAADYRRLTIRLQALVTYAGKRIQDCTIGEINAIGEPRWQKALDPNDLRAIKPQMPLLQYHGLADEVIPWQVEAALDSQWCAMGVTTHFTGCPGDHVLTQVEAQFQVVSWLGARLAGNPGSRSSRTVQHEPSRDQRPARYAVGVGSEISTRPSRR